MGSADEVRISKKTGDCRELRSNRFNYSLLLKEGKESPLPLKNKLELFPNPPAWRRVGDYFLCSIKVRRFKKLVELTFPRGNIYI